ncbi:hypothetical protein BK120_23545 [Paenibacillus sp. FSL A5-0031]|nr:hypothetical protein BK120_23545 [Paenibacillus sp. FSL A5-0031]
MTIGQVSKVFNVNIETIQYYERRDLTLEFPRTNSGCRMFSNQVVQNIEFIKRA